MTQDDSAATWERLVRFHRMTIAAMDTNLREEFGRSLDDYDVLYQVRSHDGPIRMGDLAQRLLLANSSCHRIVGRLVEDGLLQRVAGATDRREVWIQLTPAGKRQWRRMAVTHTKDIRRFLGERLSVTELTQLGGTLQRLIDGHNHVLHDGHDDGRTDRS
ncbi:MAG: MarR family transcriptional regulator [Actinomycetota bacterium]